MKGYEKENLKFRFFDIFETGYNYTLANTERLFMCSKILSLVDQGRNNSVILFFTKKYIQRIKVDHAFYLNLKVNILLVENP